MNESLGRLGAVYAHKGGVGKSYYLLLKVIENNHFLKFLLQKCQQYPYFIEKFSINSFAVGIWSALNVFKPQSPFLEAVASNEVRSLENPAVPLGRIESWGDFFGWGSGVHVTPEVAQSFSAVYACQLAISEALASLPRELYKLSQNEKNLDRTHYLARMFADAPNDHQTWFSLIQSWVVQALKHGNGYIYINRNAFGQPVSLRLLPEGQCTCYYEDSGATVVHYYYVSFIGGLVEPRDILHLTCLGNNGVEGESIISLAAESISLGMSATSTMRKVYETNFKSKPVILTDKNLNDAAFNRFKTQLSDSISNDKIILLEDGMKAETLSISPQDAETLATRKFQVEEIARMHRVPLHMIGNLDRSTNNNIEHQSKEFVSHCIEPWAIKIAQEFQCKLLMPSQKGGYEVQLDTDYITLSDLKTWSEYVKNLFYTGAMSPNDIRASRGQNRSKEAGMDKYYVQNQLIPIEMAGTVPAKPDTTKEKP